MLGTLARIGMGAAKTIWLLTRLLGTATISDYRQSGYKDPTIFEAVSYLKSNGFIVRVGFGVYRLNSALPEFQQATPEGQNSGGAEKNSALPEFQEKERNYGRAESTEAILESMGGKTMLGHSLKERNYGRAESNSALPEFQRKPVNVVNNVITNKQTNGVISISSTLEIEGIIDGLLEDVFATFVQRCHIVNQMFSIPGLSRDLVVRIVGTKFWFGFDVSMEELNSWRKEAVSAERRGTVKHAWMAVANSVKRLYEKHGVKWTKCRPNNIREIDNRLKSLKLLAEQPKEEDGNEWESVPFDEAPHKSGNFFRKVKNRPALPKEKEKRQ